MFDLTETDFKMISPSKSKDMRDPLYKPFVSSSESYSESFDSGHRSVRSEDASPLRRKMLRSPNKRKKFDGSPNRRKKFDEILEHSSLVD